MTRGELAYCADIRAKDLALRAFLQGQTLRDPPDARAWFDYLVNVKDILGNISNSIGFLATLLAKEYLAQRFDLIEFDAAEKAQGAPGADIDARTATGETIRCEIKTTRPYQPGFGAQQKKMIKDDLRKLCECTADHRLMLVTDSNAFKTLCKPYYATLAQKLDIVNLLTNEVYRHP